MSPSRKHCQDSMMKLTNKHINIHWENILDYGYSQTHINRTFYILRSSKFCNNIMHKIKIIGCGLGLLPLLIAITHSPPIKILGVHVPPSPGIAVHDNSGPLVFDNG